MVPAAAAWACLSLASINVSPTSAQPGAQITVTGAEFGKNPVDLHLGSLTGPVLATVVPDTNGNFTQAVTLPADTTIGPLVLIATEPGPATIAQPATDTAKAVPAAPNGGSSQGVPARAVVDVVAGAGGSALAPVAAATGTNPVQLVTTTSTVPTGSLILAGLGALGVGLFVAGGIALAGSRRRQLSAAPVRDR